MTNSPLFRELPSVTQPLLVNPPLLSAGAYLQDESPAIICHKVSGSGSLDEVRKSATPILSTSAFPSAGLGPASGSCSEWPRRWRFDQVVEGGEDDELVAVEADCDIAKVSEGDVFRRRDMIYDSNERLAGVEAAVDFEQLRCVCCPFTRG